MAVAVDETAGTVTAIFTTIGMAMAEDVGAADTADMEVVMATESHARCA